MPDMPLKDARIDSPDVARALGDILAAAGFAPDAPAPLTVTGADPVIPTNFLLGSAGAAVLSAVGLATADLWRLKTGRSQAVSLDVTHAVGGIRTSLYLQRDGAPIDVWAGISGFYPTKDGRWVQLHTNFSHHLQGTLDLLGCEATKESAAAKVAEWDALALETALYDRGLVGAMVRSPAEWEAHPHRAAVARLPLMEIVKIGDAPPEPLPDGDRPLSGIRALDLTRVLAGPTCGRTLAEHGADVMRIAAEKLPFTAENVMDTGHGKLNAFLDLDVADDKARLVELAREADIFTQAYRPGSLAARGLSPDDLARERPGIVYVTLSAYGHEGPWAARRGYDSLVQCTTGLAWEQGWGADTETPPPGTPPKHTPAQALDYVTGYLMAFGALVALGRRARDGGSWMVRVSLCQTSHWLKGLGRVQGQDARAMDDPWERGIEDLFVETDSPFGRLRHLGPVLGLSETPPHWDRPATPLGTHPPEWP